MSAELTPQVIRGMMRRGWNTHDLASFINQFPLYRKGNRLPWREADLWNILARDEAAKRAEAVAA